ncbi:hypothetical protein EVAR_10764_1 [Eumeta japonica]|uniref:Uncharacterized protein n=1 Tax=Eumeta variegata TaxID=151549 RepID=A0A4C1W601_EUMVA|nr:hypothetical protein EVAR_10764_1 [Eumeta japonica]
MDVEVSQPRRFICYTLHNYYGNVYYNKIEKKTVTVTVIHGHQHPLKNKQFVYGLLGESRICNRGNQAIKCYKEAESATEFSHSLDESDVLSLKHAKNLAPKILYHPVGGRRQIEQRATVRTLPATIRHDSFEVCPKNQQYRYCAPDPLPDGNYPPLRAIAACIQ